MSTCIDYTEDDVRTFAPFCKAFYRDVLLSSEGKAALADAGILANGRRLSHFLGQVGAETGGLTILRESLTYTTVKRIKEVWPARARSTTEADLAALVRNPVALGDWAYGGRMGNGKGTIAKPNRDGYAFRGGGWIQTTGREAVERYCKKLGITAPYIISGALDNPLLTLKFACLEWQEGGCNEYADADDIMRISKRINVGNANSSVTPNGMDGRRQWTAKAKKLWWDAEPVASGPSIASTGRTVLAEAEPTESDGNYAEVMQPVAEPAETVAQSKPIAKTVQSSRTVFGTLLAAIGVVLVEAKEVIAEAANQIVSLAPAREILGNLGLSATRIATVITVAGLGYAIYARLHDAKTGANVKGS